MIDFFPDLQQQLDNLSIYKKPMQFQITEIELDFEDSQGVLSHEEQNEIVDDLVGHIWEADDEDAADECGEILDIIDTHFQNK